LTYKQRKHNWLQPIMFTLFVKLINNDILRNLP